MSAVDKFVETLPADMQAEVRSLGIPDEVLATAMLREEKRRKGAVSLMLSSQRKDGDARRARGGVIKLLIESAQEAYGKWTPKTNRRQEWLAVAWAIRKLDPEGTIARWTGLTALYKQLPPEAQKPDKPAEKSNQAAKSPVTVAIKSKGKKPPQPQPN